MKTWQNVGDGRYVGSTPSRRYPVYTRGNAGEVFPEVVYPLSFTSSWYRTVAAWDRALLASGVVTAKDLDGDKAAASGVFGGYTYLNVSMLRLIAARTPGTTVDRVDRDYLGASGHPPHVPSKQDRNLWASVAVLRYLTKMLRARDLPVQAADRERVRVWRAALPDRTTATDDELVALIDPTNDLIAELFEHHIIVSGAAPAPLTMLANLLQKHLGDDTIVNELVTGIGDVASAAPSLALWDLGRIVAESPTLTSTFALGLDGLGLRLEAEPAADGFRTELARFLDTFGARGPNEWETGCDTWATDPGLVLALVDRLRLAEPDKDPHRRHAELERRRHEVTASTEAQLPRRARRPFRNYAAGAAMYLQGRERAKTTVVEAIHEARRTLIELGNRGCERALAAGIMHAHPKDIWFVTRDELSDYLREPRAFVEQIAERRAMRDYLSARVPPFMFESEQPPVQTWPMTGQRDADEPSSVSKGTVLHGIAGCPGTARGRARVVRHPSDPGDLGPGDVLVAPITDPSWTPLFVPVEAVVVDVGAVFSHAVIVSRELGIPAVVSVSGATRAIPDGALVEVDGTHGTVTVIELP